MGKVFKKVRKVVAKFDLGHQYGKKLGLPDPSGDLFYGSDKALSPQEQADALAKSQMKQAKETADRDFAAQQAQANRASAEAVEQARASAQAIQLQADRAAAEAVANANKPVDTTEVDVALGDSGGDAATRRRRFTSTSTNTGGQGGPAIRI